MCVHLKNNGIFANIVNSSAYKTMSYAINERTVVLKLTPVGRLKWQYSRGFKPIAINMLNFKIRFQKGNKLLRTAKWQKLTKTNYDQICQKISVNNIDLQAVTQCRRDILIDVEENSNSWFAINEFMLMLGYHIFNVGVDWCIQPTSKSFRQLVYYSSGPMISNTSSNTNLENRSDFWSC